LRISILTLFPDMFNGFINDSIIKRAQDKGLLEINLVNIRDFSKLNNKQVDDTPYGGGAGMVMMVEPVVDAIRSVKTDKSKVILMTPSGEVYKQNIAFKLAKCEDLIIICGHYEGIDERILNYVDMEISIGDYVLTGGEIPACVLLDSITRLIPGVITEESFINESHTNGILDYPTYTKPREFEGHEVPEVLYSGDHKKIAEYRKQAAIEKTKKNRPDLLD